MFTFRQSTARAGSGAMSVEIKSRLLRRLTKDICSINVTNDPAQHSELPIDRLQTHVDSLIIPYFVTQSGPVLICKGNNGGGYSIDCLSSERLCTDFMSATMHYFQCVTLEAC